MATGNDIITAALQENGYLGAETAIEAADAAIGLRKLNDYLIELDNSGIDLGYDPINDLADIVRIPRGAENAVIMNLSARLAVPFKVTISPEHLAATKAATDNFLRSIIKPISVEYPNNLPIGSGNECYDENRFFGDQDTGNF